MSITSLKLFVTLFDITCDVQYILEKKKMSKKRQNLKKKYK